MYTFRIANQYDIILCIYFLNYNDFNVYISNWFIIVVKRSQTVFRYLIYASLMQPSDIEMSWIYFKLTVVLNFVCENSFVTILLKLAVMKIIQCSSNI